MYFIGQETEDPQGQLLAQNHRPQKWWIKDLNTALMNKMFGALWSFPKYVFNLSGNKQKT